MFIFYVDSYVRLLIQALAQLKQHRNLGIHTEMFSDRVVDLVDVGAISNTEKVW